MTDERWIEFEDPHAAKGYTEIPNIVLRHPGISPGAKVTYMVLLSYAWKDPTCFPGLDRLAEDVNCSRDSVLRYLKELERWHLIERKRRGQGRTNLYTILNRQIPGVKKSQNATSRSRLVRVPEDANSDTNKTQVENSQDTNGKASTESLPADGGGPKRVPPSPPDPETSPGARARPARIENPGQFGVRELLERVNAARERGAPIHDPPDLGNYGRFFRTRFKRHDIETLLWTLDFLVAKAAGEVDGEKKAWCGFDTALDAVLAGWRPGGKGSSGGLGATLTDAERERVDRDNAKNAALLKELVTG